MLTFERCFIGLTIQPTLSSRDYIFIKHSNRADSYRIFARYNTVSLNTNTFRKDYSDWLGIDLTNGREWQWHHVVEGTHIEQLFNSSVANDLYKRQVPTVLIHQNTEHIDYNLFHAHGVKAVFDLPQNKKTLSNAERADLIKSLRSLYSRVYAHDVVLHTVASNILRQL